MAYFPALSPSNPPASTYGEWVNSQHFSLNGGLSVVKTSSGMVGQQLELTFSNISESDYLSILGHYRGQRSGFDSFGFTTLTLAPDETPPNHSWVYEQPPQVEDEHTDCFTVTCRFRSQPRGWIRTSGARWVSGASTLSIGAQDGGRALAWVSNASTLTPGVATGGASIGVAARWITNATTLAPGATDSGVVFGAAPAWVSAASVLVPGLRSGSAVLADGKSWASIASTFTPGATSDGNDASVYLAAVEAADGQALEAGVKAAVTAFVQGCQDDGIWGAMQAVCIMCGARTLAGALIPLKGAAPTNYNFINADYSRTKGLKGDGAINAGGSKYLDSNRAENADPQNDNHVAVFLGDTGGTYYSGGVAIATTRETTRITFDGALYLTTGNRSYSYNQTRPGDDRGFYGMSRSSSSSYTKRIPGAASTVNSVSTGNYSHTHLVFAGRGSPDDLSIRQFYPGYISFYSIGNSLNLAVLDARVNTLMDAIAASVT